MQTITSSQIRTKFIKFFVKLNHSHYPSSSLIPDNPTLLLTSAGMVQFVPIFLGQSQPPNPPRVVTVQKCARAGGKDSDIENIGQTGRHHSFFEMLGNFSFGDYFKAQVIPWAWEFITNELGLAKDKLYVSVFAGDEINQFDQEAYDIWVNTVKIDPSRIYKMSRKDNFWGPPGPTGPCGPCSEIYYDRGEQFGCNNNCGIGNCDCDRYLEIWNLVFMEFFKDEHAKYSPLAKKNIDTGAGLERLTTILQNKHNSFETDLFKPMMEQLCQLTKVEYISPLDKKYDAQKDFLRNKYLKIILDHLRCSVFLLNDGVRVSNIGRGYVLRFILRRAARFGRLLGLNEPFLYKLVDSTIQNYSEAYEELSKNSDNIKKYILDEETKFGSTIERGLNILNSWLKSDEKVFDGHKAFDLYSTYGFPLELTKEILAESGKSVDIVEFEKAAKAHEEISSVNKFNVIITGDNIYSDIKSKNGSTEFLGYSQIECASNIVAIIKDNSTTLRIEQGDNAIIILDKTVCYAESGGQLGDKGYLISSSGQAKIIDTKSKDGLNLHFINLESGYLELDQHVEVKIDQEFRYATKLHHSTAHVFHAAIRQYLGNHVMQAGSSVGPTSMRFDFNFEKQLSNQDIANIEKMMNQWILENNKVTTEVLPISEAKKTGAIAMFGEKYGDLVRLVRMGQFSLEFCGGTHVGNTGEIGMIKIMSESSIASGIRRVEALSGFKAFEYISNNLNILNQASAKLKIKPNELDKSIVKLQNDLKEKDKMIENLQSILAEQKIPQLIANSTQSGKFRVLIDHVKGIDSNQLKHIAQKIKDSHEKLIMILIASDESNASLIVSVDKDIIDNEINSNNIIKHLNKITNGSGGGRPDFAQGGFKNISSINQVVIEAKSYLENLLKTKV